jgi:uncharacterized protein YegP (UPF0339 family)
MATFTIYRDKKDEFRWRLQANNNRITADSSEGYTTKQHCQQAVERVKQEVPDASVVDNTAPAR